MSHVEAYFLLSAALTSLILAVFVYTRNRHKLVNVMWSLVCIGTVSWSLPFSIMFFVTNKEVALILAKMTMTGAILLPPLFLHFTYAFTLKPKNRDYKITLLLSYAFAIFFLTVNTTSLFVADVLPKMYYRYYWCPGFLFKYFILGFFLILGKAFFTLVGAYYQATSDHRRNQIKYAFLAAAIGFTSGSTPFFLVYDIKIPPFGNYLVMLYTFIMTYAIVRHQLMDIEVIIKKTLVFAGLLASVFAILVLPTLLIQEYIFRGASAGGKLVGLALSGVIIILSLRRIENFLVNITDKYLFQKKYDYRELLRTFTTEVLTVVNLDKLVNLTVDKLTDVVKINSSAVLLLNDEKQQFDVVVSRNVKDPSVTLSKSDGIVTFLEHTHGYLLKKELIEKKVYIPPEIHEIIDKLNAELIIPMVLHTEVKGILSLGKKKSDEDYTQDDLDILLPLARTLAIAISNAKLFDELGKTQAEAAQREKMAVIGTLSAGINHEICNPLGIARGQCEAFLLNLKDGLYSSKTDQELLDKAKDIMTKVIKETDRATAITRKLSGFAKPSKGEEEIIDIDKEIDDVLDLVGYELKLEKIEFEKQIESDLPDIFVDRKQFQQVLFNLIRNAGQAIGEKGKINVTARHDNGKVLIDIKDTGSGIPENKIRELFNPFFTTKEPGKGTGLGLFIVRQVVEKNGGKIYLKGTKVGEGTTFTVEFPVARRQESGV